MDKEQLAKAYKVLDDIISTTTERQLVSTAEVQNWILDIRSALMELETVPEPALV